MVLSGEASAMSNISVLPVPAFNDNYFWLIHNGQYAAVVDPGDASPVLAALEAHHLSLVAILLTHHHADHVGGVAKLLHQNHVPVFGPRNEDIPHVTNALSEQNTIDITELNLRLTVLDVPGHTAGHIAYVDPVRHLLFCGDTLFAGGCGRLFEGTAAQMVNSLAKLTNLPDDTQVYCAHEYTLSNLRFALEVDGNNLALQQRINMEQEKRNIGLPTLPSSIGLEKATNPFLRCRESAILQRLQTTDRINSNDPVIAFAALREWKNNF
jgi:hydroxyacylglutathione hydrolase